MHPLRRAVPLDVDGFRAHPMRSALGGKQIEKPADFLLCRITHLDGRWAIRSLDFVRLAHRDHAVLVFHVSSSLHARVSRNVLSTVVGGPADRPIEYCSIWHLHASARRLGAYFSSP